MERLLRSFFESVSERALVGRVWLAATGIRDRRWQLLIRPAGTLKCGERYPLTVVASPPPPHPPPPGLCPVSFPCCVPGPDDYFRRIHRHSPRASMTLALNISLAHLIETLLICC